MLRRCATAHTRAATAVLVRCGAAVTATATTTAAASDVVTRNARACALHHTRRRLCTATHVLHSDSVTAAPVAAATTTTTDALAQDNNGGNDNGSSDETALDVAMRVNKLKKLHQTGGSPSSKKQLEHDAWVALNALSEEQINGATGKAVSLLLNAWAYFAKYWEKGKDGPADAAPTS